MLKRKGWLIAIIITIITLFVILFMFFNISPAGSTVTQERLEKDITSILRKNGLQKDNGSMIRGNGSGYYWNYPKQDEAVESKVIDLNVRPRIVANLKNYVEVETLMEVWLYIKEREMPFNIDGITFYFSAANEIFKMVTPNEIYMSADEFSNLYQKIDHGETSIKERKKLLAKIYVEESGYQRRSGHVQVKGDGFN